MNYFTLSASSFSRLEGVDTRLVNVVRRAIEITTVDFTVIEGLRTVKRQKELFLAGKSRTLNSKHITGHAVDVMPVNAHWDKPEMWLPVLKAIRQAADELNIALRFGYTWTASPADPPARFLDASHVELYDEPSYLK